MCRLGCFISAFVLNIFDVFCPSFSWSSSSSVTWTHFNIFAFGKLVVLHSHKMATQLYLVSQMKRKQWYHPSSPKPKKFRTHRSAEKVMQIPFGMNDALLLMHCMSRGNTFTNGMERSSHKSYSARKKIKSRGLVRVWSNCILTCPSDNYNLIIGLMVNLSWRTCCLQNLIVRYHCSIYILLYVLSYKLTQLKWSMLLKNAKYITSPATEHNIWHWRHTSSLCKSMFIAIPKACKNLRIWSA